MSTLDMRLSSRHNLGMAYNSSSAGHGGSGSKNLFGKGYEIPLEYREIVEHLFKLPLLEERVISFACVLGVGEMYKKTMKSSIDEDENEQLLDHFQKNMMLLIAKTWVEKDNEFRKEKLDIRIQYCVGKIKEKKYAEALFDFRLILSELAFLFFGAQSQKADFIEYAFRMDSQLGLFCWYGKQLYLHEIMGDNAVSRSYLMVGICYLSML